MGPIGGSSVMSSIHGWRCSTASRLRLAITRDRLAPVVGHRARPGGSTTSPMTASIDQRQQLVLGAHVVVERHRAGVELGGDAAHRHGVEALGVGDADRRGGDLVAGEARLAAGAARCGSTRRAASRCGDEPVERARRAWRPWPAILLRPSLGLGDDLLGVLLRRARVFSWRPRRRVCGSLGRRCERRAGRPASRLPCRTAYC